MNLRIGMLYLFLAAVATCQTLAKSSPTPLTTEQQEALSRKLLALQDEELAYQQLQIQLLQAEKRVLAAKEDMDREIEAAKKTSGADAGCSVSKTKEWTCPK